MSEDFNYIPFPETYDRRKLNSLYREIPLRDTESRLLRKYFNAASNLMSEADTFTCTIYESRTIRNHVPVARASFYNTEIRNARCNRRLSNFRI